MSHGLTIPTPTADAIEEIVVTRQCPMEFTMEVRFKANPKVGDEYSTPDDERRYLSFIFKKQDVQTKKDDPFLVRIRREFWKEGVQSYREFLEGRKIHGKQLNEALDFVGCEERQKLQQSVSNKQQCKIIRDFVDYLCTSKLTTQVQYDKFSGGNISLTEATLSNLFATLRKDAPYLGQINFSLSRSKAGIGYELEYPPIFTPLEKLRHESSNSLYIFAGPLNWKDYPIGHANMWLIDKKQKTIELFEPHGSTALWSPTVLAAVETETNYPLSPVYHYTVIPPMDYCPKLGPQAITKDGFCNGWSTLYGFLRAKCPSVSRRDLIDELLKRDTKELLQLINNWICYVTSVMEERHVYDVEDWIDRMTGAGSPIWVQVIKIFRDEGDAPRAWALINKA